MNRIAMRKRYKNKPLGNLEEIRANILALEKETEAMISNILN